MDDYLDFFEITMLVCCLIVAQNFMEFHGGASYKVLLIKKACIHFKSFPNAKNMLIVFITNCMISQFIIKIIFGR